MGRLIPGQPVPDLAVPTLDAGEWSLAARSPEQLSLIVFYRGVHCPLCQGYLQDLERHLDGLTGHGVESLAVSMDSEDKARKSARDWGLTGLTVGYALDVGTARDWGLYLSESIKESEPPLFSEPGLFLVRPDSRLFGSVVSTMPFARPRLEDLLGGLDFVLANAYPPRGTA